MARRFDTVDGVQMDRERLLRLVAAETEQIGKERFMNKLGQSARKFEEEMDRIQRLRENIIGAGGTPKY
ncbi:hypothetical protein L917_14586 [Phytophthora nicotianae]|uniref:Uncharacterized protein n=1 Tax=Phytophthora nicotianae TaxID=4792 RepID=W2KMT0_PHYNI|nr:hypothetical protein L917_14586 [Phytophthora nicotianae]